MNELKVFTVDQANQMLPQINKLIEQIRQRRDEILKIEVQVDSLELISESTPERISPELQKKVDLYNKAVNGFYALIDEIHSLGCFLKDIDLGLIDFYAHYEGQVVYLCWKYGEPKVSFWHDIGKGFAVRKPLS